MKKAILLVLLVLASGCVGGRAFMQDANNGIKITSFEAPKEAEFFDQVFFDVKFENVGGTTAEDVKVELLGLQGSWRKGKGVNEILDYAPGKEAPKDAKPYPTATPFLMNPPLKTENKPGDFQLFSASLYPPFVPKGIENVFPVKARVTYTYATTGTLVIPLITKSLEKIKKEKGEAVDGSVKVTNTFAPLQISLRSGPQPLVADDVIYSNLPSVDTQYQDATYIIEFVNRGDGQVLDTAGGAEGSVLDGTIKIFGNGASLEQCVGVINDIDKDAATFSDLQMDLTKLRSDGSFPIPCKIRIDRSKYSATQSSAITITVEMRYRYFVEETRQVIVKGVEYDIGVLRSITPVQPTATPIPTATSVPTSTLVPTPAPQTTPTQISTPKLTPAATQAAAPTVAAPSSLKRVFVTSTSYNGAEIGGLAGGDSKCNALAAGLGGTWKAWLSSSTENAAARIFGTGNWGYRRTDGTVVADDRADLLDGSIDNPINKDEKGGSVSIAVWTGTITGGTVGEHCTSWTSSSGGGTTGLASSKDKWTDAGGSILCSSTLGLYCFEV